MSKLDSETANISIHQYLEQTLENMSKDRNLTDLTFLTRDFHLYPDFHGNRAPLADPGMTGMISGLTLDNGVENMALVYLSAIQATAYGTRHIVEEVKK